MSQESSKLSNVMQMISTNGIPPSFNQIESKTRNSGADDFVNRNFSSTATNQLLPSHRNSKSKSTSPHHTSFLKNQLFLFLAKADAISLHSLHRAPTSLSQIQIKWKKIANLNYRYDVDCVVSSVTISWTFWIKTCGWDLTIHARWAKRSPNALEFR